MQMNRLKALRKASEEYALANSMLMADVAVQTKITPHPLHFTLYFAISEK